MRLSWKARRRLSILVLVLGLPLYVVAAVSLVTFFDRPAWWVEVLIYTALGILWAFPLRWLFQADPERRDGSRE